jgi:uncharacterized protein YjiK
VRRSSISLIGIVAVVSLASFARSAQLLSTRVEAQQPDQRPPVDNRNAPLLAFDSVTDPLKLPAGMNFGEVLGVAVNSRGAIVVLNHPGTATSGPLYGNATTQILEFDTAGKFVREIGKGVYGLGYSHSVRFDKYDNLWVVDKGTNSAMKFNPAGSVVLNLGRRPEGYDSWRYERPAQADARPVDGLFNAPTDVAWDPNDNIYIGDGYVNSRIAKFDKSGNWIKSWGSFGRGGDHANENPGQINNPHNLQIDRQGNVYVADRGNRRIQVFDTDGNFKHFLFQNAPYDKTRHPVLGNRAPNPPDETAPWALCMTQGPTQFLFSADSEPGRIYKMTLDGKILGMLGLSGHDVGQFNWIHGIACPDENTLYIADMNNWRVQKILIKGPRSTTTSSR